MPHVMHAASGYVQHNLVSDVPLLADVTDPNLVNPWGVTATATSPFWVCDERTGLSTLYNTNGTPNKLVVTVPAPSGRSDPGECTGIVANTTQGFAVAPGQPALFIFDTLDGT